MPPRSAELCCFLLLLFAWMVLMVAHRFDFDYSPIALAVSPVPQSPLAMALSLPAEPIVATRPAMEFLVQRPTLFSAA
jgi:hypothetical protein